MGGVYVYVGNDGVNWRCLLWMFIVYVGLGLGGRGERGKKNFT